MQWPGEKKQNNEGTVIEGKDAESPTDIEGLEEVGLVEGV